ncbi:MAG: tol-pal system protein YbgF [Rhizobiaceae bacterium]|nr:tol-pal system protein YbgF [Rhizobiaceae bacterium]
MYFRTLLSGTLAILLVSGALAGADERTGSSTVLAAAGGLSLPKISLPKLFGSKDQPDGNLQLVQAGDPRITAMEEQLRALSGTVEELNFQILQLQEQLRKMQEDNEFRFQELEKKTDAGAPTDSNVASATANAPAPAEPADDAASVPMEPEVLVDNGTGDPAAVQSGTGGTGEPPKTFGTITFDEQGNVTGGSVGDQTTESVVAGNGGGETVVRQAIPDEAASGEAADMQVAALPSTDNADELYRNSYEFILSGDYGTAEQGFRDHIERFPQDQKAADANFWLGEALLGQKKYREAAEVFLAANKNYPSAKKAPDMLLKLGVSLVGLDQRDVACATFAEIGKKYPDASGALKDRIKQEQALAAC